MTYNMNVKLSLQFQVSSARMEHLHSELTRKPLKKLFRIKALTFFFTV